MNQPGRRLEETLARGLLLAGILYMVPFVPRGWVPHDEGMIGQSAERALMGELPHVHFQEAYTGGLTWFYAAIFGTFGINLVNIRWALLAGAALAVIVLYAILRRALSPVPAAFGAAVAIGWSFPNYFAGLPSWWVLLCALVCLWALVRYFETASLRYVAVAGLAVGLSVTIKQTGLYLVPPLMMSVWIGSDTSVRLTRLLQADRVLRGIVGVLLLGGATLLMESRLWPGEVTYLLLPIAATSIAFVLPYDDREDRKAPGAWQAMALAGGAVAVPVALLLVPYVWSGHLQEFFEGAFIEPRRRITFASFAMPPARHAGAALVLALCMMVLPGFVRGTALRVLQAVRWVAAGVFVAWSLSSTDVYQFVWQSLRALASLSPLIALWVLATDRTTGPGHRRLLFAASSILAWAALVQFPFSAPIYFCYVAPLAVTVIACASGGERSRSPLRPGPLAAMALAFAVLSMNRGYLGSLGVGHNPEKLDFPLRQLRASLTADLNEAAIYSRTVLLVRMHLGDGYLMAGPDCPEVYFLTGQFNPTGAMFDFLGAPETPDRADAETLWLGATVVVINTGPDFSPPLPEDLLSRIRETFPHGESVGSFEVRWK